MWSALFSFLTSLSGNIPMYRMLKSGDITRLIIFNLVDSRNNGKR